MRRKQPPCDTASAQTNWELGRKPEMYFWDLISNWQAKRTTGFSAVYIQVLIISLAVCVFSLLVEIRKCRKLQ